MPSRKLPGFKDINLSDLLLRLGPTETSLCATASYSDTGWGSVVAWNPVAVFKDRGGSATQTVSELDKFASQQQAQGRLVIGYLSYDFGCALRGVSLRRQEAITTPRLWAASFNNWLSFGHQGALAIAKDKTFPKTVEKILDRAPYSAAAATYDQALQPLQTRAAYNQAFEKIQSYIKAGDTYQVNLSQPFEGRTSLSGRELFRRLSKDSQANFQAYLEVGDTEILSLSPERFIMVKGRAITTMPIKGTRPRGKTPSQDKMLKQELYNSPKERSELDMITDLMRNDLGAICDIGSVDVREKRTLIAYPTIWHAHSRITAQLLPGRSPLSALASVMPGGSISGCPKKRTLQIIDELEPTRRGLYTGSVFRLKPDGELDSNIMIRTAIKQADKLYLSVGGGIVYDSKPAEEYQETLDKAESFIGGSSSLGSDI